MAPAKRRSLRCAARTCTGEHLCPAPAKCARRDGLNLGVEDVAEISWMARSTFYERLNEVRDYHRRFPTSEVTEVREQVLLANTRSCLQDESPYHAVCEQGDAGPSGLTGEPRIDFSGEEGLGRFLDLHEHYNRFINAKLGPSDTDYLGYLSLLADFAAIPQHLRLGRPYSDYLSSLLGYLVSFYERTQPLGQLEKPFKKVRQLCLSCSCWQCEGSVFCYTFFEC